MAVSLPAGTRLGPYEVIAALGAGGMGEVHLANDTRLNRKVAIKLLHAGAVERGLSHQRFESEARAISSLNHPHICALYDIGEQDGRAYLVMELLEGETIARCLTRGSLPADQALRHAIEIAQALDHAHRHGIVHRDLKPANVMLTKAGAKLLDFGVAKLQKAIPAGEPESPTVTSEQPLTKDGQVVGTVQYMAPEQLDGGTVDARTDLFAFGALVHEMATGRKAFGASSQSSLEAAIRGEHPPPISTLQPLSPPAFDRVVQKCLAKDPDERWQTARDLADALKWISQDTSQVSSSQSSAAAPVPSRRRLLLAIAVTVLLLVAAGVTGLWLWREKVAVLQATNLRLVSTFSGEHWGASFSPDGRFIAFLKEVNGVPQVWVKNLAEGEPLQVTFGDVPVRQLSWSPRDDRIVFSRFRAGLWSVPPLGGAARRVLEFGEAPKVSANGTRMVFSRGMAIWTANADGSNAREVAGVPSTPWTTDRSPVLSPDGQTIAFFQPREVPIRGDIWVIPAAGGEPRQVTFDSCESGWPRWTPDGRSIVYSSARAGSLTLWRVPAAGGTPTALTTGAGEDTEADISADGRTLLYETQRKSWSLILLDPATGQEKDVFSRRTRIVFPVFSPTGAQIAFMQASPGGAHLYVVSVDGRDVRQVTQGAGENNVIAHWSADGTSLYFYQLQPTRSFRKISVEGGTSTEVAALDYFREAFARVDPTGRAVAYRVSDGGVNQTPATRVRDLESGEEHALGRAIDGPWWSPDSQTVFGWFVSPDPSGDAWNRWNVAACPADGQPCRTLVRGFRPIPSRDGNRLFYIRDTGAALRMREVWTASLDGTNARKVADIGPLMPDGWGYDISPTNQILFARTNASRRELWAADLK